MTRDYGFSCRITEQTSVEIVRASMKHILGDASEALLQRSFSLMGEDDGLLVFPIAQKPNAIAQTIGEVSPGITLALACFNRHSSKHSTVASWLLRLTYDYASFFFLYMHIPCAQDVYAGLGGTARPPIAAALLPGDDDVDDSNNGLAQQELEDEVRTEAAGGTGRRAVAVLLQRMLSSARYVGVGVGGGVGSGGSAAAAAAVVAVFSSCRFRFVWSLISSIFLRGGGRSCTRVDNGASAQQRDDSPCTERMFFVVELADVRFQACTSQSGFWSEADDPLVIPIRLRFV